MADASGDASDGSQSLPHTNGALDLEDASRSDLRTPADPPERAPESRSESWDRPVSSFREARADEFLLEYDRRMGSPNGARFERGKRASQSVWTVEASRRDPLTRWPDRCTLLDRLSYSIAASRRRGSSLAVLFLDVDGVGQLNERFGFAGGDHVLQSAAQALQSRLRASDTVSRYGADKFVILLSELSHAPDSVLVARKVADVLVSLGDGRGASLRLSASIGISTYPEDGDNAEALVYRAHAAGCRTKMRGSDSQDSQRHALKLQGRKQELPGESEVPQSDSAMRG